jgi:hypothetical protein
MKRVARSFQSAPAALRRAVLPACAAWCCTAAQPAESPAMPPAAAAAVSPSDEAALLLADRTADALESTGDRGAFLEGALGRQNPSGDGASQWIRRASLDLHYEQEAAPGWRMSLADRVDVAAPAQVPGGPKAINTLKEAYVTWRAGSSAILDAGRVNVHEGVAMGYNPTDYFRAGAVRSVVSLDPASLRENRQGSVMVRGQGVWDAGSATLLWSPRLADASHAAGWNADLGATNGADRFLLTASRKIVGDWAPQVLLYKEPALPLQAGVNATALLGEATVLYLEWSGGRSPSLLARSLGRQTPPVAMGDAAPAFRSRAAAGATYSSADKLTFTLEFEWNGAAMREPEWDLLARFPAAYQAYRLELLQLREPPTRRALFAWARWQDAFLARLDLSAMATLDTVDRSRRTWCEARYRFDRAEAALQWQRFDGTRGSDFGASPQAMAWVVLVRGYR